MYIYVYIYIYIYPPAPWGLVACEEVSPSLPSLSFPTIPCNPLTFSFLYSLQPSSFLLFWKAARGVGPPNHGIYHHHPLVIAPRVAFQNRSKIASNFDHFCDRFLVPFWAPLGLHFGPLGRPSWAQVRSKRALGPSSFQKT